ncbi:MAG: hypothetical protein ABGZ17_31370 [Planctomycetaceae bacterium]
MKCWSRRMTIVILACGVLTSLGCSVLHDLKPHRLQRLNRGPSVGSGALYSIPSPAADHEHLRVPEMPKSSAVSTDEDGPF